MRYSFLLTAIISLVLTLSVSISSSGFQKTDNDRYDDSEQTLNEGCKLCNSKSCSSMGVPTGEVYCDVFSNKTLSRGSGKDTLKMGLFGIFAVPFIDQGQFAFRTHSVRAFKYIHLSEDGKRLFLKPSSDDLSGSYVNQKSKNYSIEIISGLSIPKKNTKNTIFGAPIEKDTPGFYHLKVGDDEYPLLFVSNQSIVILDKNNELVCSGKQLLGNKKIYLSCVYEIAKQFDRLSPTSKDKFDDVTFVLKQ